MKRKMRVYVGVGVIVLAMGSLVVSGFDQESMLYYTTIAELQTDGTAAIGKGFRVAGTVLPATIDYAPDKLSVAFTIEEEGEQLRVRYRGILPDTFKPGTDVLVEGHLAAVGDFEATNVLTKCASKYDPSQDKGNAENTGDATD